MGKIMFFASAILHCLPSGSKFDVPLEFDFPVEEEDGDVNDSELLDEELDEYNQSMRGTYQAKNNGDAWKLLEDENVSAVHEGGVPCERKSTTSVRAVLRRTSCSRTRS
ncbi:unnamed protein product [Ectocarpus sp. 4 AP-2014]